MIWYTADLDGHTNPTPLRSLTYFVGGAVGGVAASYTVGSNLLAATWAYLYPKAFGSDLRGFVETGIDSYGKNESLSGPLITNLVNNENSQKSEKSPKSFEDSWCQFPPFRRSNS